MATAADMLAKSPATREPLERFHSDSSFEARRGVQSPDTDQLLLRNKSDVATPREISFGSFRLLPAQLLLLQGDRPVPLGSRALEILIVLLERPSELVSKQELMARVWPNTFVEPENVKAHISVLRRALRDGVTEIGSLSISLGAAIALLHQSAEAGASVNHARLAEWKRL